MDKGTLVRLLQGCITYHMERDGDHLKLMILARNAVGEAYVVAIRLNGKMEEWESFCEFWACREM